MSAKKKQFTTRCKDVVARYADGAATKITAPFYTRLKQNHRFKGEVPLLHASIHLKPIKLVDIALDVLA